MAFRSPQNLKSIITRLSLRGSSTTFTTSTSPKLKPYSPAADVQDLKPRAVKVNLVPVCVAGGMILLATGLGVHTLMHQVKRAPNVHLKKSGRETLPEVEDPDQAVQHADKFLKKSFFRKVANVQSDRADVLTREPRAETLRSAGVDPKMPASN